MVYREVTMFEVKEVVLLWLAGVPKRHIARTLGLDPKTVRKYIDEASQLGLAPSSGTDVLDEQLESILVAMKTGTGRPRGDAWFRCVEHRTFIEEKLKQTKLTKVRKLLIRKGVDLPYATLHRFAVEELGFGRRATTIPVADGAPGEEVQLDTGWVGTLEPGVRASVLCPGTTATNFVNVSGAKARARPFPEMTAVDVADQCLRGVDRGKRVIVPGPMNAAHAIAGRLVPPSLAARIAGIVNRPAKPSR
jgi:hypothetical protein